ncbi:MAG: phosphoglycerate kinase [Flavobacteriaceae bacterium CG_4_8_14_3_um_filter_34_10]|nr:phosphoglycerate kinase [Flavobacteriia bacterium]OIP52100.1 MAG: phosphoglycerate kinase [Flavobacteriaceae bacterium CG2_30_34_30]PIV49196.1 MAG: phosphoglycerate kinase [Flavobacteriaceae bacterium CG02_land_8_20_14_3_00_34_13]PIX09697.1 MAG: phosphoglycerate kinase [Flavobacteriaceae bacterium CG_4_8_14_3_um_filter_34_10]PJC06968.1 MAG: phosphoglycerate kinase [Flavobacteriaceae bacterium CG_4_9_14_0_8_um_filter_34_30]
MKTLNQFHFKNKKVLIRVDFNVPLNDAFKITDDSRIRAVKPTLIKILEDGGSCILMSHLGRPKAKEEEFSLRHIVDKVSDIIGVKVKFVTDCVGPKAEEAATKLRPGEIILLENLRFHKEEEAGDKNFAKQLANLGDFYVNDAFGTAHRAHASTTIIADYFPKDKCFGLLLEKEIVSINKVLIENKKPVTAIIGGAKVSSKITIIENILETIDHLIIGGGMAFTFIKALGGNIGSSLVEDDKLPLALHILEQAKKKNVTVHLPVDAVIADSFSETANTKEQSIDTIPDGWMGLDTGQKTNAIFAGVIRESKTILWNGPVGVFEMKPFSHGTISMGIAIAEATKHGCFSLVGGGDSVAAVKQFGLEKKMSYVSTGGGAMLEMLEGKSLPGIEAILK